MTIISISAFLDKIGNADSDMDWKKTLESSNLKITVIY